MRSRRGLVVLGLLTFIVGGLVLFPARVAYHWFGGAASGDVQVSGLSGSIWSGEARELSVLGLYFRDVRWRAKPLYLFTGKLQLALEATPSSGFIESDLGITIGGKLSLTDLTASLPLASLGPALRIPGLGGAASLQFERIIVADNRPVAADGVLTVSNLAAWKIYRSGSLGGYTAEFFTQNNGISASVEDTDGVVDLAGALQVDLDGAWEFVAQVAPKPQTPDSLLRQMRMLGSADERGMRQLNFAGRL